MTPLMALVILAQMDKRADDLYDPENFAAAKPAVGTKSPDLALADLDGRPCAIGELFGETIVLVKGSYT